MNTDLVTKINTLKGSIQNLLGRMQTRKQVSTVEDVYANDYDHNYADDLPLTINRDESPGVKYYATENNPLAIGAEKVTAGGIDKFGDEEDTFSIEAADDYQTNRDRNQNSDLAERFYAPGLDTKDIH